MKSSANDGDGEEEEDDGIENEEHSVFNHCFSELPKGSEAKPVSPAKYVHEQQLLRQSLLQQQRLTNRGANDSVGQSSSATSCNATLKWSTKERSKALVAEDIAPIPVDPMYSQAG